MDLGDRLRTLEIWLIEYNLLIFNTPKPAIPPPDEVLEEFLVRQGPTPKQLITLKELLRSGGPFDYLYPLRRESRPGEYYLEKHQSDLYLLQGTRERSGILIAQSVDGVPDGRLYIPYHKL
jgi:hypothetical protein